MLNKRSLIVAVTLAAIASHPVAQPALATSEVMVPPSQTVKSLNLKLPIGDVQLFDATLQVRAGAKAGALPEGFRGSARVKLPEVGPLASLQMSDLVRAEVGLDTGAALAYLGAPLDAERRYLFLDFGGGLNVTRAITDDAGLPQNVGLAIPPGQRAVVVIDPETPLVFVLGNINVAYTGDLAVIGNLLAASGLNVSLLNSVQIPGLSSVVISGTLAPGTDRSAIGVQARTGVDAGAIGAALGVQAAPLVFRGGARLDASGLTVTGVTQSKVAPEVGWDGNAVVNLRVPFDGQQAFVDLTGALSAPLAQLQTEGASRVTVDSQVIANVIQDATNAAATAAAAAGTAAKTVGGGAVSGARVVVTAAPAAASAVVTSAVQAGSSVISGVQSAAGQVVSAAPTVAASAAAAAGSGWQSVMQQVCRATRRC
jgi:hypothetical protein